MADDPEFENEDAFDLDKLFGKGFPEGLDPDDTLGERNFEEKEVRVVGVYEHREGVQSLPFVLLRDNSGRSVLIWIGRFEAERILMALEGAVVERPMTHDLIMTILDKIGWKVERILIDDLFNETYYAKITVAKNGDLLDIDSRPSDAIAVGLRAKAPIYMAESVLEQASVREEF